MPVNIIIYDTPAEFKGEIYTFCMWKLNFSEQMVDGIRENGCWVGRYDDVDGETHYIIAKGNRIEGIKAKW